MQIDAASRNSSLTSNSLAIDSAFSDSGVAIWMVGRPILVGITASIPKEQNERCGWLSGSGSVGPEHHEEFFYTFPFSGV